MIVLVLDLDGTLIDNNKRFEDFLKKHKRFDKKNLHIFFSRERVLKDKPLIDILKVQKLIEKADHAVLLTGRNEEFRDQTREWLDNYGISKNIKLFMRPKNSGPVKSHVVKEKILKNDIMNLFEGASFVFIDDEPKNLKMFSDYGIALKSPEEWDVIFKAWGIDD